MATPDSPQTHPTAEMVIVIPTYNEAGNVRGIVEAVLNNSNADILIVDDNSPDGTGQIADQLCQQNPRVHVLHRTQKEGLGRAYIAGFKWALARQYQYIMEMDADFSHDPRYLPDFAREIEHADVVLGSRNISGGGTVNWSLLRQFISKGGSLYARNVLGIDVLDLTGGYKCFRRRVLEAINLDAIRSNGYAFQIEMTFRAIQLGFRVKEIPIIFVDRRVGASKMSRKIFMEAVTMCWKLRMES